jgi:succinate dehydrogenase / fumarate reductase membrane anchor subunit
MAVYGKNHKSQAFGWFLHRVSGTFLVFLLLTHFWIQHFDATSASVTHSTTAAFTFDDANEAVVNNVIEEEDLELVQSLLGDEGAFDSGFASLPQATRERILIAADALPTYSEQAQAAVNERRAVGVLPGDVGDPVTSYDVAMLRLADPVYAVLWKAFNIFFLLFALHHGFYGLNNILTDYIRNPLARVTAVTLSWGLALVLLIIGLYSVVMAGWGLG